MVVWSSWLTLVALGILRIRLRLENPLARGSNEEVDKTLRKYASFDEMKADEYLYWQSRPVHERFEAVEEMIATAYALKGWKMEPDVPRSQRPFVRVQCPWR